MGCGTSVVQRRILLLSQVVEHVSGLMIYYCVVTIHLDHFHANSDETIAKFHVYRHVFIEAHKCFHWVRFQVTASEVIREQFGRRQKKIFS